MYKPRERRIDLSLNELRSSSSELATALHSLRWLVRDQDEPEWSIQNDPGRGRPRRIEKLDPRKIQSAPIPELAIAAAQEASKIVTGIDRVDLLLKARQYELDHDARTSVVKVIERRLRALKKRGPVSTLSAPQEQV